MSIIDEQQLADIPEHILPSDKHGHKKWNIVLAAAKLFINKGLVNTGVRDIAEASGITIGPIYYYFKSKDDIVDAFVDYCIFGTDYFKKVIPVIVGAVGPEEGLRAAIRSQIEGIVKTRDITLFWYQETKNINAEARKKLLDNERKQTTLFENIIDIGKERGVFSSSVDSRLAAHNIIMLADMWALRGWDIGKQYTPESFIDKQVDFIMRSLYDEELVRAKKNRGVKGRKQR
jgi:AcrR family transcriptional regulator